jgi:hypothetical protein
MVFVEMLGVSISFKMFRIPDCNTPVDTPTEEI